MVIVTNVFFTVGMNEVNLHTFIGKCPAETLELLFPNVEKKIITAEQMKAVVVFEESCGREDTITLFFQYLSELEKYEAGIANVT